MSVLVGSVGHLYRVHYPYNIFSMKQNENTCSYSIVGRVEELTALEETPY
jgi:hypothetical protein